MVREKREVKLKVLGKRRSCMGGMDMRSSNGVMRRILGHKNRKRRVLQSNIDRRCNGNATTKQEGMAVSLALSFIWREAE